MGFLFARFCFIHSLIFPFAFMKRIEMSERTFIGNFQLHFVVRLCDYPKNDDINASSVKPLGFRISVVSIRSCNEIKNFVFLCTLANLHFHNTLMIESYLCVCLCLPSCLLDLLVITVSMQRTPHDSLLYNSHIVLSISEGESIIRYIWVHFIPVNIYKSELFEDFYEWFDHLISDEVSYSMFHCWQRSIK